MSSLCMTTKVDDSETIRLILGGALSDELNKRAAARCPHASGISRIFAFAHAPGLVK